MSNANRDYAIVYDVKNSTLVLSRPLVFYITDKNTSNIFVRLVTRIIIGDGIDQYTDIENASNYVLTMRVIKPNDEIKSIQAIQHESESIFQFDLTEDFKDVPGKYICELTISNIVNGRQEFTTSDPFSYEVKQSILSKVNIIECGGTTVEKLLNDLDATKAELSSRIDNLAKLTEGSTTGDAELIDGRIGANSKIYNNIGENIRDIAKGNGLLDNSISIDKLKESEFKCTKPNWDSFTLKTDDTGNWCNNIVYKKGFIYNIKLLIKGNENVTGKVFLYKVYDNGEMEYNREYDVTNSSGNISITVNEYIDFDFMISTKIKNVAYDHFSDCSSADLGYRVDRFSPNFNSNYAFAIGVELRGIEERVSVIEQQYDNKVFLKDKWKGKKINFIGDSVTKGEDPENNYEAMVGYRYTDLVKENCGFDVVNNYGIGGSRVTSHSSELYPKYGMVDRYLDIEPDADVICLFGGINDYLNNVEIGTNNDGDLTHFKYAYEQIIRGLMNNNPRSKIFVITPHHIANQSINCFNPNGAGYTLKDYVNVIYEICELYGVPIVDLYKNFSVSPYIGYHHNFYIPDGIHPNKAGMKLLADKVINFINNLL